MSQSERWITEDGRWSWDGASWRRVTPIAVPLWLTIGGFLCGDLEGLLVVWASTNAGNGVGNADIWVVPALAGLVIVPVGLGLVGAGISTWLIRREMIKGARIWTTSGSESPAPGTTDPMPTPR